MQRLIILKQGLQFELLPQITDIASSLPMSSVWPEREASCLERLKTRLRSRIKVDMLNTLMLISGHDLYSPECNELIESAVLLWNKKKNRRKLPPKVPVETESTAFVAVLYSVDSACQTEACEKRLLLWNNPFLMKVMLYWHWVYLRKIVNVLTMTFILTLSLTNFNFKIGHANIIRRFVPV